MRVRLIRKAICLFSLVTPSILNLMPGLNALINNHAYGGGLIVTESMKEQLSGLNV